MNKFKNKIKNPFVQLTFTLLLIVIIASLLSSFRYRVDLTAEKRYTMSDLTKQTLRGLKDKIHIKIYLDGDLNIPFLKMQKRLKETMEEFQVYADDNLEYEFINPFSEKKSKDKDKLVNELMDKGLKPTNILDKDKEGGSIEKLVFPGALIQYKNNEIPVNLLKNNPRSTAEENINNSVESFEFEIIRIISSLVSDTVEKIAFIEGHGEFNEYQVGDISTELGWNFQVDRGKIDNNPGILDEYKAVIIAGPVNKFSEKEKFILDQYLMKGGKILFFVDLVNASLDSISQGNLSMAMIRDLNIEDMLFRYGIRINPVLLQDVQCSTIPVNIALAGNAPDFKPAPWLYSPLLTPPKTNPITRNINMVKSEFVNSIDTISGRYAIKKTPLLKTSQFTRQVAAPLIISLNEIRIVPRQEDFKDQFLSVAVLLEGKFESVFRNRMVSDMFPDTSINFIESGIHSSVLVVADADIIRNDVRLTPQEVLIAPLGFDKYTSQTYGNKEFIVNCIQYMTGHKELINLRSKKLAIRLLDKNKIKNERRKWVILNTLMPSLIVLLGGLIYLWFRKRKYSV